MVQSQEGEGASGRMQPGIGLLTKAGSSFDREKGAQDS